MKTRLFIASAILCIISVSASAQNGNRSLRDENRRIKGGVVSGQLTAAEAARLKAQEASIRREAIRYKTNDGRIGPRERADLRRDQKRLDRNICRQKHDRQRRH